MSTIFKSNRDIYPFIYNEIEKAKSSIRVAVAWFTDPEFLKLLLLKRDSQRIDLQIILFNDALNHRLDQIGLLSDSIRVSNLTEKAIMHHKFIILDNKCVITGSYNYTIKARRYNRENVLQLFEKGIVDSFEFEFSNLRSNSVPFREIETFRSVDKISSIEDEALLQLEQDFNREILSKIEQAQQLKIKIDIALAYHLIHKHTPVIAATNLAMAENGTLIQEALSKLQNSGHLELSFEESIIKKKYSSLLRSEIIEFAKGKLRSLNYFTDARYTNLQEQYT